MSAKKRIVLNGIATSLHKLVLAGQHLILVPFFLKAWGAAYYGEWLTLSAVPMAFTLSDLGFGSAVANEFVIRYVEGSKKKAADYMVTGRSMLIIICFVVLGLSAIGIYFAWKEGWLKAMEMPENIALAALALLIVSRILCFYNALSEAYLRAACKAHIAIHLATTFMALRLLSGMLVLLCKGNALHLAIVDVSITILSVIILQWIGTISLPDLPKGKLALSRQELVVLVRKSFSYMLSPLRHIISLQGTTLLVRGLWGPESVALFNTLRTLVNSIIQVFLAINDSVFPELQLALAEKRLRSVRALYLGAIIATISIGLVGVAILALFGPWLYQTWTHQTLIPSWGLWCIFFVNILLGALWLTASIVFRAANKPEGFTLAGLLSALIGVSVSWLLGKAGGLEGVGVGLLVAEFLMVLYVMPASCKLISLSIKNIPEELRELNITITQLLSRKFNVKCRR